MATGINIANAIGFYQLADTLGLQDLKDYCLHWLGNHYHVWNAIKEKDIDKNLLNLIEEHRYPPAKYEKQLVAYERDLQAWQKRLDKYKTKDKEGCCIQ